MPSPVDGTMAGFPLPGEAWQVCPQSTHTAPTPAPRAASAARVPRRRLHAPPSRRGDSDTVGGGGGGRIKGPATGTIRPDRAPAAERPRAAGRPESQGAWEAHVRGGAFPGGRRSPVAARAIRRWTAGAGPFASA